MVTEHSEATRVRWERARRQSALPLELLAARGIPLRRDAVAAVLGITHEAVRFHESNALRKLLDAGHRDVVRFLLERAIEERNTELTPSALRLRAFRGRQRRAAVAVEADQ